MKGRNPHLIKLRNEHLVKRYYYWYELKRLRRDDVLEILSTKEVFLDIAYINTVLLQNSELLKQLKSSKVSERKLDNFMFRDADFVTGELFAALVN